MNSSQVLEGSVPIILTESGNNLIPSTTAPVLNFFNNADVTVPNTFTSYIFLIPLKGEEFLEQSLRHS